MALRALVVRFLDFHNVQACVLLHSASSPLAAAARALARCGLPTAVVAHGERIADAAARARLGAPAGATLVVCEGADDAASARAQAGAQPRVVLGVAGSEDAGVDGGGELRLPGAHLVDFVDAATFPGALCESEAAADASLAIGFGPHRVGPEQIFFETGLSCALVNIKPVLPGHALVVSRRRCARFTSLTPDEVADLWRSAQRVGAALERHWRQVHRRSVSCAPVFVSLYRDQPN
jgi:hypothetical protein